MQLVRAAIIAGSLALLWFTPHMDAHMHATMHAQSDTTKFVPFRSHRFVQHAETILNNYLKAKT